MIACALPPLRQLLEVWICGTIRCLSLSRRCASAQAEATDLRKQMEELRTQLQRNEEMVRWLNNQVRGADLTISRSVSCRHRPCDTERHASVSFQTS